MHLANCDRKIPFSVYDHTNLSKIFPVPFITIWME